MDFASQYKVNDLNSDMPTRKINHSLEICEDVPM